MRILLKSFTPVFPINFRDVEHVGLRVHYLQLHTAVGAIFALHVPAGRWIPLDPLTTASKPAAQVTKECHFQLQTLFLPQLLRPLPRLLLFLVLLDFFLSPRLPIVGKVIDGPTPPIE